MSKALLAAFEVLLLIIIFICCINLVSTLGKSVLQTLVWLIVAMVLGVFEYAMLKAQ